MTDDARYPATIGAFEREVRTYGKIAGALAKAQAAYPAVVKSSEVEIRSERTNRSFKFRYAPLDAILDAVRKPLADNALAVTQVLTEAHLVTMLIHESGEYLEGKMAVPRGEDIKALGANITYLRRYALQAMLGVAAEEDTDGPQGDAGGRDPSAGLQAAINTRLRDTERANARQSGPRAAPNAPAAPEAKTGAPGASEPVDEKADEHERMRQAGVPVAVVPNGPSADPDEAAKQAADMLTAGVVPSPDDGQTGLTMEEFTKTARERGFLTGAVVAQAKVNFPGRTFTTKADIEALTDDERFALMMALLANV